MSMPVFDSRDPRCKYPYGALPCSTRVLGGHVHGPARGLGGHLGLGAHELEEVPADGDGALPCSTRIFLTLRPPQAEGFVSCMLVALAEFGVSRCGGNGRGRSGRSRPGRTSPAWRGCRRRPSAASRPTPPRRTVRFSPARPPARCAG